MFRINRIWLYKFLAGLLSAGLITIVILVLTDKYKIKLISSTSSGQTITTVFYDLNHDGFNEKIKYEQYFELKATVTIYENEKIISHKFQDFICYHAILKKSRYKQKIRLLNIFYIGGIALLLLCI